MRYEAFRYCCCLLLSRMAQYFIVLILWIGALSTFFVNNKIHACACTDCIINDKFKVLLEAGQRRVRYAGDEISVSSYRGYGVGGGGGWDRETMFSQIAKRSASQRFLEWAGKFFAVINFCLLAFYKTAGYCLDDCFVWYHICQQSIAKLALTFSNEIRLFFS